MQFRLHIQRVPGVEADVRPDIEKRVLRRSQVSHDHGEGLQQTFLHLAGEEEEGEVGKQAQVDGMAKTQVGLDGDVEHGLDDALVEPVAA